MIKIENLKKTYFSKIAVEVLKNISFEIKEGEFIAIMGRSGSGKSTLLRQMGLIDVPTGGKIIINDTDVLTFSEEQKTSYRLKQLGYIFQEYALIPELTALENVYLPAFALGSDRGDCEKNARELLKTVGLGDRLNHYPSELSGGEQQRVAIARSLINKPKILFADEPTANLDSVSAKVVLDLLKKLNREFGQTIVMVTHEPEDKKYVCKIVWLKDGLVEKIENFHSNFAK